MQEDPTMAGKAEQFEKAYRQAFARKLDALQLIGVDVSFWLI